MKIGLGLLAVVLSTTGFGAPLGALPEGHWTGGGHARMQNGEQASYTEVATVRGNVLTNELTVEGQRYAYETTVTLDANGFATVRIADKVRGTVQPGRGYCASMWCHWQSDSGDYEMTIVFEGSHLYELGSSVEQGQRGWFESSLDRAP